MPSPSTHASLLERLATGGAPDQDAWAVFADRYGTLIRDYGRRRGLQADDCDDLLQDVLLSLTKAMPGFRYDPAKGRLRAYLKTVAMRAVSSLVSKKTRQDGGGVSLEVVEEPVADEGEALWEQAWRHHHVRRALGLLGKEFPERTLQAFQLYVLEERGADETASLLGMSVDAVYQSKSRVLRRVSELIAAHVSEEG